METLPPPIVRVVSCSPSTRSVLVNSCEDCSYKKKPFKQTESEWTEGVFSRGTANASGTVSVSTVSPSPSYAIDYTPTDRPDYGFDHRIIQEDLNKNNDEELVEKQK